MHDFTKFTCHKKENGTHYGSNDGIKWFPLRKVGISEISDSSCCNECVFQSYSKYSKYSYRICRAPDIDCVGVVMKLDENHGKPKVSPIKATDFLEKMSDIESINNAKAQEITDEMIEKINGCLEQSVYQQSLVSNRRATMTIVADGSDDRQIQNLSQTLLKKQLHEAGWNVTISECRKVVPDSTRMSSTITLAFPSSTRK